MNGITRRQFAAALAAPALLRAGEAEIAAPFDEEIGKFMRDRKVPGGALAVFKGGQIVFAKGYGFADREKQLPVQATSLFRIASISKPITAVAVLKLVGAGKLSLDAKLTDFLPIEPHFENGAVFDERHRAITIRHLLQHTGGWDREASGDPMFRARKIAAALGVKSPPQSRDIIRFMLGRRLDFAPGTRYAYSNFGYCLLGRIIEKATGTGYEDYVRREVLAPCRISTMRLGHTLDGQQAPGEVRYYTRGDAKAPSVFADGETPLPYGAWALEAMDAHGGWLASATDLARFATAFHDPAKCPILSAEGIREMFAAPPPPLPQNRDVHYACGWSVRKAAGGINTWHNGSLDGTASLLVRRHDGLGWAVLFNQRSADDSAIDPAMHRAARRLAGQ